MTVRSTVTVRLKIKPEAHDEFLRILKLVTSSVQEREPDCFIYATWKTATPYEYLMVEGYWTPEGRTHHEDLNREHGKPFLATLSEPPVVETLGDMLFGELYPQPSA